MPGETPKQVWNITIGPTWRVRIEAGNPHLIVLLHRDSRNAWAEVERFHGAPRRLKQIFADRRIPVSGPAARRLARVPDAMAPRDKPERELPREH